MLSIRHANTDLPSKRINDFLVGSNCAIEKRLIKFLKAPKVLSLKDDYGGEERE